MRAYETGDGTCPELAARFYVGKETVARLVRQYRKTGSLEPKQTPRGRKDTLRGEALEHLKALVEEDNSRFLHELVQLLQDRRCLPFNSERQHSPNVGLPKPIPFH